MVMTFMKSGLSVLFLVMAAQAAEVKWINAAGGNFHDPLNWSSQTVPGNGDVIVFDRDAVYAVTWSGDTSVFGYQVNAGDVTWDLQGHTQTLNTDSTNNIGLTTSAASLTVTDGAVVRPGGYTGTAKAFKLEGTGSRLRILGGGQYRGLYYVKFAEGTEVLVDGSNAKLSHTGYAHYIKNSVVVTNGAVWELSSEIRLFDGGDLRISGGQSEHKLTFSKLGKGSSVLLADGADVECGSCGDQYMQGIFTLKDATYRYYYKNAATTKGELIVFGPDAVLQGSGAVKFWSLWNWGGRSDPAGVMQSGLWRLQAGSQTLFRMRVCLNLSLPERRRGRMTVLCFTTMAAVMRRRVTRMPAGIPGER